jgi:hypothetical protein
MTREVTLETAKTLPATRIITAISNTAEAVGLGSSPLEFLDSGYLGKIGSVQFTVVATRAADDVEGAWAEAVDEARDNDFAVISSEDEETIAALVGDSQNLLVISSAME